MGDRGGITEKKKKIGKSGILSDGNRPGKDIMSRELYCQKEKKDLYPQNSPERTECRNHMEYRNRGTEHEIFITNYY